MGGWEGGAGVGVGSWSGVEGTGKEREGSGW